MAGESCNFRLLLLLIVSQISLTLTSSIRLDSPTLEQPSWTQVNQCLEFRLFSLSMYSERDSNKDHLSGLCGSLFLGSHVHAGCGLRQCRQAASIKTKDVQKELKKETQELRQSTKSRKACDNMSSRVLCCLLLGCRSAAFTSGVLYRFYASLFFSTAFIRMHALLQARRSSKSKGGRGDGSPTD